MTRHPAGASLLPVGAALLVAAPGFGAGAGAVSAQPTATVQVEENVRAAPNGEVLGRLFPGTVLDVVNRSDRWLEVELEGWVWMRSLQTTSRQDLGLVISAEGGENLRAAPSGVVVGRLNEGTLLSEVERRPGWIRVRRRGFIWASSVEVAEGDDAARDRSAAAPAGEAAEPVPQSLRAAERPLSIRAAPDGDTLAYVLPGTELEVTARRGRWARVRLEGWAWIPEDPAPDTAPQVLEPSDLQAEPGAHVGRLVSWRLQYISLERAEPVRTDFYQGEPFMLCRFGSEDGPFVYVAVPPERLGEVEGLLPLEFVRVVGRVRTGASALTGTPVIDLASLSRERAR